MGQLYVSIFVAVFLCVFKPFDMSQVENLYSVAFGFGLVSIIFSASFELLCQYVFKIRTDVSSWTLWKWLLQCLLLVSWIAFGNYLFLKLINGQSFGGLMSWLGIWQATITLGIIPIFFSGLVIQIRAEEINKRQAEGLELPEGSVQSSPVVEFALSSSKTLQLKVSNLLFVEATQNYVTLFIMDNGVVKREMVRDTIAHTWDVFQQVGLNNVVRCHRSYLVNIDSIEAVTGNAQGLKLTFRCASNDIVPVSRSYIMSFRNSLEFVTRPTPV